jgi:hypothetical protein
MKHLQLSGDVLHCRGKADHGITRFVIAFTEAHRTHRSHADGRTCNSSEDFNHGVSLASLTLTKLAPVIGLATATIALACGFLDRLFADCAAKAGFGFYCHVFLASNGFQAAGLDYYATILQLHA